VPRLLAQLVALEQRRAREERDTIDHAPHAHDDLVNAAAALLLAQRAYKAAAFTFQLQGLATVTKRAASSSSAVTTTNATELSLPERTHDLHRQRRTRVEIATSFFLDGGNRYAIFDPEVAMSPQSGRRDTEGDFRSGVCSTALPASRRRQGALRIG